MRSDTETVDSTTYYRLLTSNTTTSTSDTEGWSSSRKPTRGFIRAQIYVYHADGTEDLIATTDHIEVPEGAGIDVYSVSVGIPETALSTTDRIKVVWQWSKEASTWYNFSDAKFITEQLNTTILNAATWTIYIYAEFTSTWNAFLKQYTNTVKIYWGNSTYPSRIENFSWGTAAPEGQPYISKIQGITGMRTWGGISS